MGDLWKRRLRRLALLWSTREGHLRRLVLRLRVLQRLAVRLPLRCMQLLGRLLVLWWRHGEDRKRNRRLLLALLR